MTLHRRGLDAFLCWLNVVKAQFSVSSYSFQHTSHAGYLEPVKSFSDFCLNSIFYLLPVGFDIVFVFPTKWKYQSTWVNKNIAFTKLGQCWTRGFSVRPRLMFHWNNFFGEENCFSSIYHFWRGCQTFIATYSDELYTIMLTWPNTSSITSFLRRQFPELCNYTTSIAKSLRPFFYLCPSDFFYSRQASIFLPCKLEKKARKRNNSKVYIVFLLFVSTVPWWQNIKYKIYWRHFFPSLKKCFYSCRERRWAITVLPWHTCFL